ncbi:MAG: FecR domain-containing protein [Proteobacteria bacterium]|nr:FecR domain-containing protein [Pseudomonadota bacterium]
MSDENDDRYWSKLGETLRPKRPEASWAAQRARVLSRLRAASAPVVRVWVLASAAAACAAVWFGTKSIETRQAQLVQAPTAMVAWDARLSSVQGEVAIVLRGDAQTRQAAAGTPVDRGDEIRTGADGRVELALSSEGMIELGPNSSLTVANLEEKHTFIDLARGTLVAKLKWLKSEGRRLEVRSPTAVCAVRGTEFGVEVAEDGKTDVAVFDEGKVAVHPKDSPTVQDTLIEPHQEVTVAPGPAVNIQHREGKAFLEVRKIERLERHRERLERVRARQEEMRRSWTPIPRQERQRARVRLERRDHGFARPPGFGPRNQNERRMGIPERRDANRRVFDEPRRGNQVDRQLREQRRDQQRQERQRQVEQRRRDQQFQREQRKIQDEERRRTQQAQREERQRHLEERRRENQRQREQGRERNQTGPQQGRPDHQRPGDHRQQDHQRPHDQPGRQPGQPGHQPGQPGHQPGQPGQQPGQPHRPPQRDDRRQDRRDRRDDRRDDRKDDRRNDRGGRGPR